MSMINKLASLLNSYLFIDGIKDYGLNGLQVEASPFVNKIGVAVSVNQRVINEAIRLNIDTLIVHHGLYWGKDYQPIKNIFGERIRQLIKKNINLLAYHLPLDVHSEIGNNFLLGKELGIEGSPDSLIKPHGIVYTSVFNQSSDFLISKLKNKINPGIHVYHQKDHLYKIAWCTGAGADFMDDLIDIDCFITGEISERHYDIAFEKNCMLIEAGHYATETLGIKALGEQLKKEGHDVVFIDAWSPK